MAGQRHRLIDIAINSPDSLDQWQHGKGIITSVAFREEIERYLTTTLSFRPGDIFCVEEPKATAVDLSDSSDWNEGINSEVRLWTQTLGTRHHMRRLRTERAMPERAFNMQVLELLNYPPGKPDRRVRCGFRPGHCFGLHKRSAPYQTHLCRPPCRRISLALRIIRLPSTGKAHQSQR